MAAPLLGVLAQGVPNPGPGFLYSPATGTPGRRAVVSTLAIAETGGVSGIFRVHCYNAGGSPGVGNAIAYNVPYSANDANFLTLGITLGPGDVIQVYSSTGTVTFTLFGNEEDVPTS